MKAKLWSPLAPLGLAIAALAFGLDQTHKMWMLNVYGIGERVSVPLTPFFELVMVWNRGVSYGLFQSHQQGFLIAIAIAITALLWGWLCRCERPMTVWALALIIGGALSNALDRAIHGAVADFFHFYIGGFSWYVFNLADVAIVAGVLILLYESLFGRRAPERRGNA